MFAFTFIADAQTQTAPANNEQPKVVKALAPIYPATAKAVNAEGNVIVEIKINATGEVTSAKAVSGHPLLRTISVLAAKRRKFEVVDNKKLERKAQLTFSYKVAK
ncbi:MAG TPA: TonB family protein, partial [Pyrinomonadaceae bacterium]|nr:TonB family protein [Pyrinomonadaceae bacterium]